MLAKKRLFQATTALLVILSLVGVATFFLALKWTEIAGGVGENQKTIVVSGKGEVLAVPDIAEISFSVVEEADTVSEAQKLATEKINKVTKFLEESGIEKKDIQTTYYNLNPKYEYFYEYNGVKCLSNYCPPPYVYKNEIIGYELTHGMQVKVRKIDEAGEIIAGLADFEVRNLHGISLIVEDEEKLKEEARSIAISDARAKAKSRAKALGVRLGKVVSFNEDGYYPTPLYYGRAETVSVDGYGYGGGEGVEKIAPDIPVGENKIISNVQIVYEIK